MRRTGGVGLLVATLITLGVSAALAAWRASDRFDHWQHRKLFPTCQACHPGAQDASKPLWPAAQGCATCHDGTIEKRVEWSPPSGPTPSNRRFSHAGHAEKADQRLPADSVRCASCHLEAGAPWMAVKRSAVRQCLDCHGIKTEHLAAADSACATCHVTLAEAKGLPRARVGRFPEPPSHRDPAFMEQHGDLATPAAAAAKTVGVAQSCATCHAREFCITCHVNAPEVPAIQALAPDERSLALRSELLAPTSHSAPDFPVHHGRAARREPQTCATCHTQQSCLTCHVAQPGVAVALHASGPGRGQGASLKRRRPPSHGDDFTDAHGPFASAARKSCSACHARADCLACHRPDPASGLGYHPVGFLSRHPASAYARETSCAECHNSGSFCTDCHQQAGLTSRGPLQPGFHDANSGFLLGHGPAARQNLESCVTCHAERDCLTCHSALGGRNFNPHGPGFDAARLKRKNPQMCSACHGASIPSP